MHAGSGALVLAMDREFVPNLLYRSGERRVVSVCRRMSQQSHAARDLSSLDHRLLTYEPC